MNLFTIYTTPSPRCNGPGIIVTITILIMTIDQQWHLHNHDGPHPPHHLHLAPKPSTSSSWQWHHQHFHHDNGIINIIFDNMVFTLIITNLASVHCFCLLACHQAQVLLSSLPEGQVDNCRGVRNESWHIEFNDYKKEKALMIMIRVGHVVLFICGCSFCRLICAYPHETA